MYKRLKGLRLLMQKRMLLILLLGFASGLPLGLSGAALQAWYAFDGVDIVTIGFLGLVGQPYVYKFIWAPFMDKWQMPFLGRRRGWMLTTQIGLIVTLCLMAMIRPAEHPYLLAMLALWLAFLSASQDIVIDGYRTELLTADERGLGTAMAVSGYRVAMLVSGGLVLILAHYLGFSKAYLLMALLMGVGVLMTLWATESPVTPSKQQHFFTFFIEPFKEFISRPQAIALLAFIVFYKLGDAFAGNLTVAFLIKGVGFSLKDVGLINKTVSLAATLIGVFVGGILMIRWGLFRSLFLFGIVQALTNLLFLLLAQVGQHYGLLVATLFLENFAGGLGTAAFMALVMSLCHRQYTATQFALLSSFSAIGRVFVGPAAGIMVDRLGWSEFFIWSTLFALPGLLLLCWLRPTIKAYGSNQDQEELQAVLREEASA